MNPMMAAKAYAAVQGGAMPTGLSGAAQAPGDGGFADLVKNAMTDMTQQSRAAETQMTKSVQGQGNLIDVVTALSSAEASLETVISVRDQVISAYKEIMAMPI
ncbi:flagellar hook-basal body complex protein FliE [Brevundimonas sp. TWP1-2-1b1]|uniref:flagellar hook-basal body complex protein FliE n=1 Tax=unclassified Brevundimonas TaxID=2622653 RepID=UPI003CF4EF39